MSQQDGRRDRSKRITDRTVLLGVAHKLRPLVFVDRAARADERRHCVGCVCGALLIVRLAEVDECMRDTEAPIEVVGALKCTEKRAKDIGVAGAALEQAVQLGRIVAGGGGAADERRENREERRLRGRQRVA